MREVLSLATCRAAEHAAVQYHLHYSILRLRKPTLSHIVLYQAASQTCEQCARCEPYRFHIVIPFGHSKVLPVSLSLTISPTAVDACPLQLE
jgi:hypothetical protein